jgi:hypothetical protein
MSATATSTSQAQIDANRVNAQLSTGPKSDAGKRASSANALRTGLTAAKLYIRPEEQPAFDDLCQSLKAEILPQGALQSALFDTILHASWNIQRCATLEAEVQLEAAEAGLSDAMLDEQFGRKIDRLYRYKRMHETSRRQALAELRKLKTEELWRVENQIAAADLSAVADTKAVCYELHRSSDARSKTHLNEIRALVASVNLPPPALPLAAQSGQ